MFVYLSKQGPQLNGIKEQKQNESQGLHLFLGLIILLNEMWAILSTSIGLCSQIMKINHSKYGTCQTNPKIFNLYQSEFLTGAHFLTETKIKRKRKKNNRFVCANLFIEF